MHGFLCAEKRHLRGGISSETKAKKVFLSSVRTKDRARNHAAACSAREGFTARFSLATQHTKPDKNAQRISKQRELLVLPLTHAVQRYKHDQPRATRRYVGLRTPLQVQRLWGVRKDMETLNRGQALEDLSLSTKTAMAV